MTRDFPERYRPLCRRLGFDRGIPWTRHWSAAADFLELLLEEVTRHRPPLVLECGSGLSTLVLAAACREAGAGRVTSLEQEPRCAAATRRALAVYGLEGWAQVVDAPLVERRLEGDRWSWYDLSGVGPGRFGLVVVDGPPALEEPRARYPALPLLADRLAPDWRLLLDDAARPGERAVVAAWLARWPGLEHRYLPLERGCSLLSGALSGGSSSAGASGAS